MQSFMVMLLTCSVTMSALALFYMAVTPLFAKRYSEKGRYYAWLIVVIWLIIPFRPQFNNAFIKVDVPSGTVTPIIQIGNGTPITVPFGNTALPPALPSISWWQIAAAVWLAGVIVFLAYHVIKLLLCKNGKALERKHYGRTDIDFASKPKIRNGYIHAN